MKKPILRLAAILVAASMAMGAFAVQAASKSFASHKVVLQISDPNPFKQTLVLNVASNLIKYYGEDDIDVEIVAFGPGLRLLFQGNANKGRITGLGAKGVRFSACSNTIRNMRKKHDIKLGSYAVKVKAGVVRILDLVKEGYVLIKP